MNEARSSRHGQRGRTARSTRLCPSVEVLEDRTLPSVNFVEVEPNNNRAHANVIARVLETPVTVDGKVNSLGDHDWFKIQLKAGDVFGAALKGKGNLDPTISLVNSAGALMIANDDSFLFGSTYLPKESPLPSNHASDRDSEIYYVISAPGTYYLQVSAFGDETAGKYQLDVMVARPALESQPVGTKQILFLDFDGAKVNFNHFSDDFITGKRTLAPLAASLPDWGLTAADENAVIDAILAKVTEKLSTYVGANGLNGDFAHTGIPGQFGIEIRNSRDDRDTFGKDPFVSRIVIGAINDPAFLGAVNGLAQDVDVGNFKTDDEAVATIDWFQYALAAYPIQPPATVAEAAAAGIADLVVHEAGHLFGCLHTDQSLTDPFAGTPNVMDPNGITILGPDYIFGSADDVNLQFGVDSYSSTSAESWSGIDDTLNTVAFGLSTGRRAARECGPQQNAMLQTPTLPADAFFAHFAAAEEDAWIDSNFFGRSRRKK